MIASEAFFVDSNILVYAVDRSDAAKHASAKKFIMEQENNALACMSIQNLVEFHFAATNRIEKPIPLYESLQIIAELKSIFSVKRYHSKTVIAAIRLQQLYGVHFWDALIAATMQENHIQTIYTENEKDFKKIPGINVINPLK